MPAHDASGQLLLIEADDSRRSLAFGLSWFALVGSHIPALARARARRLRATHYVVGGLGAVAGGCARLPPPARRRPVHAAAQAFAHHHPDGTVACVAPLPDGRWWLAAAQDGAVLARADRLYDDAARADAAVRDLAAQYPSLRRLDGAQVLAVVMASADAATLMRPVGSRWARLPWPVRAFIGVLAVALAAPPAWRAWQRPTRAVAPELAVTAEEAWQEAAARFRQRQPVHRLDELGRAIASLYRLPLNVRGWVLREARCQPGPRAWSCTAQYARSRGDATNDAFSRVLPAGWRLQFRPLEGADLSWTAPGDGVSLADATPPGAAHIEGVVASALQRAQPAFTRISLGPAAAVPIPAPRDAQGRAFAPVPGPPLRQRALVLQGPLRSFALLADSSFVATWSSLVLRLAAGRAPDMAVSTLTAELHGTLYETD